jgi:TolA-binding protein
MRNSLKVLILGSCILSLASCLKTRNDVDELEQRQVMQQQVSTIQQKNADTNSRLSDLETATRETNGRIDVVDAKLRSRELQVAADMKLQADNQMALAKKMDLIQEEVLQLQGQVQALQAELGSSKAESKKSSQKKSSFDEANEKFNQKDWKRAILAFQKFREDNPKSAKLPEAIYKIGASFQELGMSTEAKSFYDEVVVKYPKSADATKAKSKLRNLK